MPFSQTLEAIRRAFEAHGLAFIDDNGGGRGVRFNAPVPDVPGAGGEESGE